MTQPAHHAAEQAAIEMGSKSAYVGAVGSVLGWLTTSDAAVVVGIMVGVAGLVVQIAATWRRDRREERESQARIRLLEEQASQLEGRQ
jgi:hypothetical protein